MGGSECTKGKGVTLWLVDGVGPECHLDLVLCHPLQRVFLPTQLECLLFQSCSPHPYLPTVALNTTYVKLITD